mmetsp:Transcript_46079/g.147439  ORF Transcript_46079/g.147439 Transcript_46079/m.147439 type:complete len:878 (-) Transcript_46079:623-3256(-)
MRRASANAKRRKPEEMRGVGGKESGILISSDQRNTRMSKERFMRMTERNLTLKRKLSGVVDENTVLENQVSDVSIRASSEIDDIEADVDTDVGANLLNAKQKAIVQAKCANMEIRRKASIDWLRERRLRKEAVLSGIVYICFMSLYFFVILEQARVMDAHNLEFSLREYLTTVDDGEGNTFEDLRNDEQIWNWYENGLLVALFPEKQWYNGDEWTDEEDNYIMHYNRLVGGFKMVQRRVEKDWSGCIRSKRFMDFYGNCWPPLSPGSTTKEPYGPDYDPEKYLWEPDAFGGGYHVELTLDRKLAFETIKELRRDRWTDKSTRMLAVEFVIYNGNMRLFTLVNAEMHIAPTGMVTQSYNMETFRVELYRDYRDWARLACEIIFLLFVISTLYFEYMEVFKPPIEFGQRLMFWEHQKRYWMSAWNLMDQTRIVMFLVIIIKYGIILNHEQIKDLQLPLPEGQSYARLDDIATAWREYKRLNGFNVVLCLLTIFKFMNKSPRYGILVRTITRAAPDLFKFAIMFILCLMCFAIMGILMFGSALEEWSNAWAAIQTLFMMITGEYGYDPIMKVDSVGAPIFYLMYLMIVFFLLINILLAIMMDAYTALREDMDKERQEMLHKFEFPIAMEFYYAIVGTFAKFLPFWKPPVFLRTHEILQRLEDNEVIAEKCWLDFPPATMNNPDPPPEEIVSWDLLQTALPEDEARFVMIFVGVPVPNEDTINYQEKPNFSGTTKQMMRTLSSSRPNNSLRRGEHVVDDLVRGDSDDALQGAGDSVADGSPKPGEDGDVAARMEAMERQLRLVLSTLETSHPPSSSSAAAPATAGPLTEAYIGRLDEKMDLILGQLEMGKVPRRVSDIDRLAFEEPTIPGAITPGAKGSST